MKAKKRNTLIALAMVASLGAGAMVAAQDENAAPQTLKTEPLVIETAAGKKIKFTVEIAETPIEQKIGLMFRTTMPRDHGMLFLSGKEPRQTAFWMQNTRIPLDMIFVRADGVIENIVENAVPGSLEPRPSTGPVTGAIELNGGVTKEQGIAAGDRVIHDWFR
jgi:uncharacterized protein